MTESFGIYIHIPFCKQACHYCDFHFSTSLKKKPELVDALIQELVLRKNELNGFVHTIYFGGGTPSLLSRQELQEIMETIHSNFRVSKDAEVTLEANPDDLTTDKIHELSETTINRLSIGIQSFYDEDLQLMNRAHSAAEAIYSIQESKKFFNNISVDLIYGIPGMSDSRWIGNMKTAIALDIPHISSYALTVEPRTALKKFIDSGKISPVEEAVSERQYKILVDFMENHGYDNYEFSNFGKPGFESRNNTAYWEGKFYLGIGPSAHSYNGACRSWNVSNNSSYIKKIKESILPSQSEELSLKERYNEYIMTALRTKKGVALEKIEKDFGSEFLSYLMEQGKQHFEKGNLICTDGIIRIAPHVKFIGDGISGDLFFV